jgi:hypothetical protein
METHSILAGKTYRTADDEFRTVRRIEGGMVVYRLVQAEPRLIARVDDLTLPLKDFASDVESEVA